MADTNLLRLWLDCDRDGAYDTLMGTMKLAEHGFTDLSRNVELLQTAKTDTDRVYSVLQHLDGCVEHVVRALTAPMQAVVTANRAAGGQGPVTIQQIAKHYLSSTEQYDTSAAATWLIAECTAVTTNTGVANWVGLIAEGSNRHPADLLLNVKLVHPGSVYTQEVRANSLTMLEMMEADARNQILSHLTHLEKLRENVKSDVASLFFGGTPQFESLVKVSEMLNGDAAIWLQERQQHTVIDPQQLCGVFVTDYMKQMREHTETMSSFARAQLKRRTLSHAASFQEVCERLTLATQYAKMQPIKQDRTLAGVATDFLITSLPAEYTLVQGTETTLKCALACAMRCAGVRYADIHWTEPFKRVCTMYKVNINVMGNNNAHTRYTSEGHAHNKDIYLYNTNTVWYCVALLENGAVLPIPPFPPAFSE